MTSFPVYFQLGPAAVSAHFVFELLAFFLGYRYFVFLRRRQADPITDTNRLWVLVGAAAGALIGSRVLGALENPALFLEAPNVFLYVFSSKTIVGGLLGGLIGVEYTKKIIGEKQSSGDLFTYPLMLAMMIGRVGCFSSGLAEPTYGTPSDLPWAIDLGDGIPRHPAPLYEIAFLGLLWLILLAAERKKPLRSGMRFQLFMVGYLLYRFGLEYLKPGFFWPFGLSSIQLACLGGLFYYRKTLLTLFTRPKLLANG